MLTSCNAQLNHDLHDLATDTGVYLGQPGPCCSSRCCCTAAGEVELPEFFQIMTMTREAEAEATFWGDEFGGDESISEVFHIHNIGKDSTIKVPKTVS